MTHSFFRTVIITVFYRKMAISFLQNIKYHLNRARLWLLTPSKPKGKSNGLVHLNFSHPVDLAQW
jgi:hypothetical protein